MIIKLEFIQIEEELDKFSTNKEELEVCEKVIYFF